MTSYGALPGSTLLDLNFSAMEIRVSTKLKDMSTGLGWSYGSPTGRDGEWSILYEYPVPELRYTVELVRQLLSDEYQQSVVREQLENLEVKDYSCSLRGRYPSRKPLRSDVMRAVHKVGKGGTDDRDSSSEDINRHDGHVTVAEAVVRTMQDLTKHGKRKLSTYKA